MATFVGMDVDQVNQLGKELTTRADQINEISSRIDDLIRRMVGIWRGSDADRFADWWSGQHRPALRAVHDAIEGLAQSAKNNASEQTRISGTDSLASAGTPSGGAHSPSTASPPAQTGTADGAAPGHIGSTSGSLAGSDRAWQQVSAAYEANAAAIGVPASYLAGHEYGYQCTAWAVYRWRELGFTGDFGYGNGWEMAANNGGTTSMPPTLGAMASYGSAANYGHVMIVEEVSDEGGRVRISEMNAVDGKVEAHPYEYLSSRVLVQQGDGTWAAEGGKNVGAVTFANLPSGT